MRQIESILWGMFAAIGALFFEAIVFVLVSIFFIPGKELSLDFSSPLNYILIASIITEEAFKYLIIAKKIESFSYGRSLIVNSLLVGLGFSLIELLLIYGKFFANLNLSFGPGEIIGLVLLHVLTSGIIGYFVAFQGAKKYRTLIQTIVLVSLIHFSYNALVICPNEFTNFLIIFLLGILAAVNVFNIAVINKKLAG